MRSKLPVFLILFFVSILTFGQVSGGINDGMNYGFTLIPTIEKDSEEVEGSPYYTQDFIRGTVKIQEKDPLEAYLKYNVAEERIEIKTHLESPRTYQLPAGSDAEFIIESEKFVLDKITAEKGSVFGYFVELQTGDKYRLLKKPIAHFREGEKAKTGYGNDKPATITIEDEYYIVPKSGMAINVRAKSKDLKKAFGSKEVEDYLDNNKMKSEDDLIRFVGFLNQ